MKKTTSSVNSKYSYYYFRMIEEICRFLARIYPLILFDKVYCSAKYRRTIGEKLNLENPRTFNEKIQWLKLYDRNPLYTQLADKYAVREYVKDCIGEQYLNELYGVYASVDEIDFEKLPNQFALKATHGCGWNIICSDKEKLDIEKTKAKLRKWLKKNWYDIKGEWQYRNIPPRIICEKYIGDKNLNVATDYKFFCFNGNPKYVDVIIGRYINFMAAYFDEKWKLQPFHENYPLLTEELPEPPQLDLMLILAKKLSSEVDFCRVDFYNFNNEVIFGEFTIHHSSGFVHWIPPEYDHKLGTLFTLHHKSK